MVVRIPTGTTQARECRSLFVDIPSNLSQDKHHQTETFVIFWSNTIPLYPPTYIDELVCSVTVNGIIFLCLYMAPFNVLKL